MSTNKKRSDWIGNEKEEKIIHLLKTTTLTYPQIGENWM
jgi:hypothetical protein